MAGIFCANSDDTRRVISERQLLLLRELGAGLAEARTVQDACALSIRGMETNRHDVPFAVLYLLDPDQRHAVLAGTTNVAPATPTERPTRPPRYRWRGRPCAGKRGGEQMVPRNAATGRDVPILVNAAPQRDASGAITGGVVVFQDITAIRGLERTREEFLSSAAHLRPLRARRERGGTHPGYGHRPDHRPRDSGAAWRHGLRGESGGPGFDLHDPLAPRDLTHIHRVEFDSPPTEVGW